MGARQEVKRPEVEPDRGQACFRAVQASLTLILFARQGAEPQPPTGGPETPKPKTQKNPMRPRIGVGVWVRWGSCDRGWCRPGHDQAGRAGPAWRSSIRSHVM
jgi:hypothetical protein